MKVHVLMDRDIALTPAGPVVSCKKGDELDGVNDAHAAYLHGKGIVKIDGHKAVKARRAKPKKAAEKKDGDDGGDAET